MTIRVLIADDHEIIRDGLKQIIAMQSDMAVVGEAANGHELLVLLRDTKAHVLLLDMSMPGKSGIALIQHIRSSYPTLPILVLSMYQESQYGVQAIRAGASGYVTKSTASSQLIDAIRQIAKGGTAIPQGVAEKLVKQMHQPTPTLPHTLLTPREFQIFQLLVEGHAINDIAQALALSNKTVSTHKANILEKMDIPTTAGLVYYALKQGLIHEAP